MKDLIEKARSAIGSDTLNDYKITPTNFSDNFEKTAPEISTVLRHSTFQEIAGRYEQYDIAAVLSQNKFKRFAHQATWAICFATVAGSFIAGLSAANFKPSWILTSILFLLGLISTIGGGIAVFRLYQIKCEKLLDRWMADRANAETERLGYFNSLSRYLVDNFRTDIYLHLLFIFMFKRYQLEVQRIYYTTRGGEHRISLTKTSKIGAVAALCLALGSGGMGMIGAFFPDFLPIAALGTIGAAIGVVASRREDLNQDERNAERYGRTADILSKIAEKYDDVLAIVKNGKTPEIIIEYVNAVNDQLSLEHRQWTSNTSEMSSALSVLEKSISNLHKE
ncbi:MAG: hypothetical protein K8R67_04710 [Desulfobacteraceae bacterium]|nr:hypothetical protein [Desulfobacteraceae bacterium]